jgi:hypothetical protein
VASHACFRDGEIHTALKDFIPGTDHRALLAFINIEPPIQLADQCISFMTHEANRLKPRIKYPTENEKQKFETFRTNVDKMAHEQNLAGQMVTDADMPADA